MENPKTKKRMPSFENVSDPTGNAPPKNPARENAEDTAPGEVAPSAARRPTSWASIAAHSQELIKGEYAPADSSPADTTPEESTTDAEALEALEASAKAPEESTPTADAETLAEVAQEPAALAEAPAETEAPTQVAEVPVAEVEAPAEVADPPVEATKASAEKRSKPTLAAHGAAHSEDVIYISTEVTDADTATEAAVNEVEHEQSLAASRSGDQSEAVPSEPLQTSETAEAEAASQTEPEAPKPQRIDDSQLPDPDPSILQGVKPASNSNRGRLRRGRTKTVSSQASAGQPGEIVNLKEFDERASGPLANAKPEDVKPRGRRPNRSTEPRESEPDAPVLAAEGDGQADGSAERPKRRRGGKGRQRKPAEAMANTHEDNTEHWSPRTPPAETAEAPKLGWLSQIAAFLGKLFGAGKAKASSEPAKQALSKQAPRPASRSPRKANPQRDRPASGSDHSDDAPTGDDELKRRRRGKRGGRKRRGNRQNKPDSSQAQG